MAEMWRPPTLARTMTQIAADDERPLPMGSEEWWLSMARPPTRCLRVGKGKWPPSTQCVAHLSSSGRRSRRRSSSCLAERRGLATVQDHVSAPTLRRVLKI